MYRRIVPLVALMALGGAACAQESDAVRVDAAAPIELLRAAPDAAAEAGTSQFEMVMEIESAELPVPLEVTASGSADFTALRMEMEIDMGAMFKALAEAEGEPVPAEFDGPWRMVVDGGDVYLRGPMFEMLTGTSGWLHISPDELGVDLGELGVGGPTQDPSQSLEWLRGVSDGVEVLGEDTIRGVETTHYGARIDFAKALAQLPAEQREALQELTSELPAGLDELPVEIWIDGGGLPRRMQMALDAAAMGAAGLDGSVSMTIEYFGYGEPVDIDVPSPDEVTDFGDAFDGSGAEFEQIGEAIPS